MDIQVDDRLVITAGDAAAMDLHGKMRSAKSTKDIWWEHARFASNAEWSVILERIDTSGGQLRVRKSEYGTLCEIEVIVNADNLSVLRDWYGDQR